MLVQRRLIPALQANLAKSVPSSADTTEAEFPFALPLNTKEKLKIESIEGNALVVSFVDKKMLDEMPNQNIEAIGEQLFSVMENLNNIPLVQNEGGNITPLKRTLILDFKDVERVESSALGKLITLNKMAKARDHKLILCNISEDIYENFQITRLNKLFDIRRTREDAIVVANGLGERERLDKPFFVPVTVKT